jgi:hypothetical protein
MLRTLYYVNKTSSPEHLNKSHVTIRFQSKGPSVCGTVDRERAEQRHIGRLNNNSLKCSSSYGTNYSPIRNSFILNKTNQHEATTSRDTKGVVNRSVSNGE